MCAFSTKPTKPGFLSVQQLIRDSQQSEMQPVAERSSETQKYRLKNVFDSAEAKTLVWHRMCYAHFTDKSKIERLQKTEPMSSKEEASCSSSGTSSSVRRSLRSGKQPVNWNLCIFCQTLLEVPLLLQLTSSFDGTGSKSSAAVRFCSYP